MTSCSKLVCIRVSGHLSQPLRATDHGLCEEIHTHSVDKMIIIVMIATDTNC